MTGAGLLHVLLMGAALAIGAGLFAQPKGTPAHRRSGRIFVAAVLISNLIVFTIYEDSRTPGVFHGLAVVSFLSVCLGLVLARRRSGGPGTRIAHGHVMLWSFGGMVAAGLGQGATLFGFNPWPAILLTLALTGLAAARLDFAAMLRRA